ncbi:hypothetical protein KUCAC02_017633 [Chaenocephalus aceratus]|uniref:Uncharacterized protein n=1 Tax=Chaenocephalus aceratus TaxID=36190 RepID=A0ACB9W2E2_CHAAC|nr:hypothetical protein KUCAC02_017633 [Chaenocephalus aceratus]
MPACPVWERAAHAKKLDPALNASCRIITGCLKSTPTDRLYILAGIAPPEIRRNAASKKERQQQSTDQRHPLVGLVPKAALNPGSFLKSVPPLGTPSISSERVTRTDCWEKRWQSNLQL